MFEAYEVGVSSQERVQYEAWLGVDQVLNPRKTRHTVCFSLFWKNLHSAEPDLPKPTRAILKKAKELGDYLIVGLHDDDII